MARKGTMRRSSAPGVKRIQAVRNIAYYDTVYDLADQWTICRAVDNGQRAHQHTRFSMGGIEGTLAGRRDRRVFAS